MRVCWYVCMFVTYKRSDAQALWRAKRRDRPEPAKKAHAPRPPLPSPEQVEKRKNREGKRQQQKISGEVLALAMEIIPVSARPRHVDLINDRFKVRDFAGMRAALGIYVSDLDSQAADKFAFEWDKRVLAWTSGLLY